MLPYVSFLFLYWVKFCSCCSHRVFFIWKTKKWSLVALDRWSSFTKTTVWEFAWTDSVLVVLDEWSCYKGGCLNRFDYNSSTVFKLLSDCLANLYACNSRFEIRKSITGKLFLCVLKINFKTVKTSSTCLLR